MTQVFLCVCFGRPIAHAASGRVSTVAARVRYQVRSSGICGEQGGTGAGFLRVFRFPLPILIPPNVARLLMSIHINGICCLR
jgi:hypothetical protein